MSLRTQVIHCYSMTPTTATATVMGHDWGISKTHRHTDRYTDTYTDRQTDVLLVVVMGRRTVNTHAGSRRPRTQSTESAR